MRIGVKSSRSLLALGGMIGFDKVKVRRVLVSKSEDINVERVVSLSCGK